MAVDPTSFLPLKPVWFHLLLTLAEQPAHGYAIRQEVEARTAGKLRLWPATLYGTIGELQDHGLIEEVSPTAPSDDMARRTYRLTTLGRRVLLAEADRLEGLARQARASTQRRRPT